MVWRSQDLQSFHLDWVAAVFVFDLQRDLRADQASKKRNHPILASNPAK
jgi:hypothetical protein